MTTTTFIGNTTAPAELRFTTNGVAVANVTLAANDRRYNKQTQEWEDVGTTFLRVTAWRELAEHIGETLTTKGLPVIAVGKLKQNSWENEDGEKRTSIELEAESMGPDLRRCTALVKKAGGSARQPQGSSADPWAADHRDQPSSASEAPF